MAMGKKTPQITLKPLHSKDLGFFGGPFFCLIAIARQAR
jgi:hypothetical protein